MHKTSPVWLGSFPNSSSEGLFYLNAGSPRQFADRRVESMPTPTLMQDTGGFLKIGAWFWACRLPQPGEQVPE